MTRFLSVPLLCFVALVLSEPRRAEAGPSDIDSARLQSLLEELSQFGKQPEGGVSRLAFSEADQAAREWLIETMKGTGLDVWVDAAANIHGRRSGTDPSLPGILFGSHIDTVPQGGNFDGCLGTLAALEVLRTLQANRTATRHPLEMVVWSNEEGVRFGGGTFGSRAVTKGPDPGELDLSNEQGVSVSDWLGRYGADPHQIASARMDAKNYAAYMELHIEQGGVLDQRGIQIGVVEGIVGIYRHDVRIEGDANHAGTTPMAERRDALHAAARLILAVREEVMAKPGTQVGNVGWVKASPGAPNVVPGVVLMPIELRALRGEVIDDMMARIRVRADALSTDERVSITIVPVSKEEPALMSTGIQDLIEKVAQEAGFSTLRMPSGAGHDAQSMARHGIPTGMIFVPSKNGISHSPKEWTDWEDCARGAEVLYRAILELDRR